MKASVRALWTLLGAVPVMIVLSVARPANAQFGIDTGLIITVITQLNTIFSSQVTPVLTAMSKIQAQQAAFTQTVIYPQAQISSAWQSANQVRQVMQTGQTLFSQPYNSATLQQTAALEKQLLGGNPNNVSSLGSNYTIVYGSLPSSTTVSSDVRSVVDISDAHAQAGLKKAIQLDAIAQQEEQLSQQFMQELSSASPGTAALVDAQAAAWNLQAHAYTQAGLAEILRIQSAQTSYESFQIKHSSSAHQSAVQNLNLGIK